MHKYTHNLTARIIMILMLCATAFSLPSAVNAEEKSLYQRLGGYDAISAVVNEFADRLFTDKKLAPFFGALSTDSRERFKQLNTLLVCMATGGPCTYLGRAMATSHQGMKVTDADFDTVAGHLMATLNKFKVPATERDELMGIIGALRGGIVEQEG